MNQQNEMAPKNGIIFNDCIELSGVIRHRTAGAYRIASEFRKLGIEVQVIEGWNILTLENTDPVKLLLDKFMNENTMFVGFSSTFFSNSYKIYFNRAEKNNTRNLKSSHVISDNPFYLPWNQLIDLKRYVKTKKTDCDFIIGGAQADKSDGHISDYKFLGYSETQVADYLKYKDKKNPFWMPKLENGQRIVNNNPKADGFDFCSSIIKYETSDCIQPGEVLPIEVSRGCIFKCKFCAFPLNGKSKNDYLKKPDVLYSELMENYEKWGITKYVISDDTFNDSTKKLETLLKVVGKLPFDFNFASYTRLDLIGAHNEQIQLIKDLGCVSIIFGMETLNQKAAACIGKGGNIEKHIETLYKCRESWGDSVYTMSGFILGLPYDTYETMEAWVQRVVDFNFPLHTVSFNELGLRSGGEAINKSEFEINSIKYGYEILPDGNWKNELYGTSQKGCNDLHKEVNSYMKSIGRSFDIAFSIPYLNTLGYSNKKIIANKNFLNYHLLSYHMNAKYNTYFKSLVSHG
jgi:hypothetical protein